MRPCTVSLFRSGLRHSVPNNEPPPGPVEVFPGGQIMQPFECFDAASQGTIEAFMGSPQYWTDKELALEWFGTIPFGMNPQGMAAWYYQGDGLKLCEEAYAAFNLVPRPAMSNGPQMAGWFRKKINTIGDFKGLKMRIGTGLGGKVYVKAGGTAVLTPVPKSTPPSSGG